MEKKPTNPVNNSLKLLVKTSVIVFIGLLISKILGYTYRIIIARYFGPETYGLFSLAIVISGWFIAVSALGLSEGLLRFIPLYRGKKEYEKIKYLFRYILIILTITSILSGLLLFFLSGIIATNIFHNSGLIIFLRIFSILVPASVIGYPFLAALRAHEEIPWYSFIFNIAQNVIKVAFIGLFVLLGIIANDIVAWSYLIGVASILLIGYLVCKYKIPHIFYKDRLAEEDKILLKREIFSYSIPILFYSLISTIFYWIDSFSIGIYKSAIEVGFYNAAVPLAMVLGIAPELFMQLFFPMITREYSKRNIGLIEELSKQVSKWILLVNLPALALMLVFPGAFINIFFGSQYLVAQNALRILVIGSFISSLFIVSNNLVSMIGKSKLVLMNIVIASAINLALNSILVPMQKIGFIDNSLGLNGAAIATLVSVIVFNLLFVFQAYKHLSIVPLRKKMLNLVISAGIATSLLFYARTIINSNDLLTLSLLIFAFLAIYIGLIFATKSLDENDFMIIKSIWKKVLG